MKQLMIMRHAKSSWKDDSISDHDRPLNPRGNAIAPKMGHFVGEKQCLPELILSSTANRAISTAELFVQSANCDIPIVSQRSLYHPDLDDYRDAVYSLTNEQSRIMIVSHNPGSEEWIYSLTRQYQSMPTAAIAIVQFDDDFMWVEMNRSTRGELVDIWRPKEVL